MKTKYHSILTAFVFALSANASAQGLLNKVKNAAAQEANKLNSQQAVNPSNENKLSANVTRTVALKLGDDEAFNYSENCIDLGSSVNQVSFIVTKRNGNDTQCYSYKNGSRTPVACPTNLSDCTTSLQCSYNKLIDASDDERKKYVIDQTESHDVQTPKVNDEQLKMMSAYMTKEQLETVKKQMAEAAKQAQGQTYTAVTSSSIHFNGKTYGPFKQITQFSLTQDRRNFYAVTMEDSQNGMEIRYKIVTSASSATLTSPGMTTPMACFVSPDNSEFGMFLSGNDAKFKLITSSGKSYEVSNAGSSIAAWYSATGNRSEERRVGKECRL